MRSFSRHELVALLILLLLTTCNAQGIGNRAGEDLVLGPLIQVEEKGNLLVVWWTASPGLAQVQLETTTPITVTATSREWKADASPPLDRAWQRVARLPDLPPGTDVPYRLLLDGTNLGPERPFTLRVPPKEPPLRLAVIGDYGAGTQWARDVHDVLASRQPDVLLTAGDNAYSRGKYDEFRTRVFALYADLMAQIPFMPAIGNHDNYTAHARPYLNFFVLPENAWRPQDRERYYSFDLANAHIVVLDSTDPLQNITDLALDDMADWLDADLAATDKPWRIVLFHHPPYSAGAHGSHMQARARLVPILERHHVQFVFNGHEHDYQRTCPLREAACVSPREGVTYVITGGGGAWLRPTGEDWFTAKALSIHEAAFLTLDRCTATLEVIDRKGNVVDTFALSRCETYYLPWHTVAARALPMCAVTRDGVCVQ